MLFLTDHDHVQGDARVAGAIHDLVMSTGLVPGHAADLAPGAVPAQGLVIPAPGLAAAPIPAPAAAPGLALIVRVLVASLTLAASHLMRAKASHALNLSEQVRNLPTLNMV